MFLLLINCAYEMSGRAKPYTASVVSLLILELSTLLSTAYVENKKYSIKSVGLAQYDRNCWSKFY
ncbi:hypothetical protein W01_13320 [Candidatus Nitrotoga sp. AM1P]|nr:hypothetical protein W01_13320 [Candidatus Nitrotoga sp. AM1P]